MNEIPQQLNGHWKLIRSEGNIDTAEAIYLDIYPDGTLIYSIEDKGKTQIIQLSWRAENQQLVTDQPSAPREERTDFSFDQNGLLMLKTPENISWFQRTEKKQVSQQGH